MKIHQAFVLLLFAGILSGCRTATMESITQEEKAGEVEAVGDNSEAEQVIPEVVKLPMEEEELPAVELSCANSTPVILVAPLQFMERKNCRFGKRGNLSKAEGRIRAIESQSKLLKMPPAKEICNLSFKSTHDLLHYDDYLFITLNDRVLVSSEQKWVTLLDDIDNFKNFDFKKLRNQDHSFVEDDETYGTPYCYSDSDCQIPNHDQPGPLVFKIDQDKSGRLSKLAEKEPDFTFTVLATGDNDYGDCDFSSFDLELTVAYIPKS